MAFTTWRDGPSGDVPEVREGVSDEVVRARHPAEEPDGLAGEAGEGEF